METMPSVFLNDPVYIKIREDAEIAFQHLYDDYQRNIEYERSLKIYRDNYAILTTERREGFAEGYAEGRAEGFAKGRAEGFAKGRAESDAFMIKKLHSNGMAIHEIASVTGFTSEEIKKFVES